MDYKVMLDTIWVIVASMLVFFMNLGFAMVESGFNRSKNTVNILSKNFIVFAVSTLGYLMLGWGLMFGDGNAFVGLKGWFFLNGLDNSPAVGQSYLGVYSALSWASVPLLAKFFFQLVFCGTAATIVSGAVAERIKYLSFILFSFIMTIFIYPITGHWIWGAGWLQKLGMLDFAGSTVVHSVGGWAAMAGIMVLGPRFGKYGNNGKITPIPGHNLSIATMGTFVLWFGWFGFNPGSTMAADFNAISHIAVTTNTAAATATLSATIASWVILGKPDLGMTLNGCLAGLVAITAGCAYVSISSSLIIGLISGLLVVLSVIGFDRLKLDDPVGALSVHLLNGIFGTLAVGLFAQDKIGGFSSPNGLFYGGGVKLFLAQLAGVFTVGAYVFTISYVVWLVLKITLGIRVSLQEEIQGLDIGEHGNYAYPEFLIRKNY
ncbi:ammonium transporter [Atribacter laminatus]|uniref:Ammonium transporter n=1 Tax=Atribacter laminatus TaxID=2847778 RepID=A0A7T1F2D4_ATRLM|nr:ammonium transporter [Atribacter laminatus]QPM67667.1 Ammonia channel [Atribacter laminatus]